MRQKKRYEYACDECDYRSIVLETAKKPRFKDIVKKAKQLGWKLTDDQSLICPTCIELQTGTAFCDAEAHSSGGHLKIKLTAVFVSLFFALSAMVVFSNNKPLGHNGVIVDVPEEDTVEEMVAISPELAEKIGADPEKFLDSQEAIPENVESLHNVSALASTPAKTINEIKQEIKIQLEEQDAPLTNHNTTAVPILKKPTPIETNVVSKKTYKPITHGKFIIFSNTVTATLARSIKDIGLNFIHVKKLISIFSYRIDFRRLAKGDQFSIIFDKNDFKKNATSAKILAAEFKTRNKVYQRFYYTNSKGKSAYYLLSGKGPLKTITKITQGTRSGFLRYPLRYNHISSNFNLRRRHPVTGRIRPHRGTDFAAPRGTKVWSTSDGVVKFAGRQRGYGRVVYINHRGGKYITVYAHLKKIARGIRRGTRVKQKQIIGYVGSSGTSTGNHLHYEFRVRGHAVNPLRVRLPQTSTIVKTKIIDPSEKLRFKAQSRMMSAELKLSSSKISAL